MSREGSSNLPVVGIVVALAVLIAGGVRNFLLLFLLIFGIIWLWDWTTESKISTKDIDVSASVYDMGDIDDTNFTARVTANIRNASRLNLQTVDFVVTVYDCPTEGTPLDLCRKLTRERGEFRPYADPDTYATAVTNIYFTGVPIPSGVRSYAVDWSNPIGDSDLRIPSDRS